MVDNKQVSSDFRGMMAVPATCPPLPGEPAGKPCYKCDTEMVYEEKQHSTIIDGSVIFIQCPECFYEPEKGDHYEIL